MTTRSQKRKAVAELASGEFEASKAENNQTESSVAARSKYTKFQSEKLDEIMSKLKKNNFLIYF